MTEAPENKTDTTPAAEINISSNCQHIGTGNTVSLIFKNLQLELGTSGLRSPNLFKALYGEV